MPNVEPSKENGYFMLQRADFPDSFRVCVYAQSCLTLCNLMNCSLPGSSVPGIFQARVLEWVAIAFSKIIRYFILILGMIEGRRRRWQRMRWLDGHRLNVHEFEQTPGDSVELGSLECSVHRVAESDRS